MDNDFCFLYKFVWERLDMKIKTIEKNNKIISIFSGEEKVITDVQSALDLIMTSKYEYNTNLIAVDKKIVADDFFVLSSGVAGEILQKFVNYQAKLAIFGDYSKYTSKPLKDFIFESNKGKNVFFVDDENQAIEKLSMA